MRRHAEILRTDPEGVEKVIRAIRYLHDVATTGADDLARELKFFRKNRHRMRYQRTPRPQAQHRIGNCGSRE